VARGISTATIVRRGAAIAIAAAAATGLSACGAGQVTQTDTKQTAISGVNLDAGDLSLRDLQVEYPAESGGYEQGGTAPLQVWISNEGEESISLIGIVTDAAEQVTLVEAGEPGVDVQETTEPPRDDMTSDAPAGESTEDATDENTDGATDESTDQATEEPAGEEPTSIGSAEFEPIELTPGSFVRLDSGVENGDYFLLEGLAEELLAGQNVIVTFLFSNGQEVEVEIPVGQPDADGGQDRSYLEQPGYGH
jgi:copper(I)-binding protein